LAATQHTSTAPAQGRQHLNNDHTPGVTQESTPSFHQARVYTVARLNVQLERTLPRPYQVDHVGRPPLPTLKAQAS